MNCTEGDCVGEWVPAGRDVGDCLLDGALFDPFLLAYDYTQLCIPCSDASSSLHSPTRPSPPTRRSLDTRRRMWRGRSLCVGSDISWGIANELCKMMDLAPTDLELPENLHLDLPDFAR